MRLPRFRIRTLMIAVMVVGTGIGTSVLLVRSSEYRARAILAKQAETAAKKEEAGHQKLFLMSKDLSLLFARRAAEHSSLDERSRQLPFRNPASFYAELSLRQAESAVHARDLANMSGERAVYFGRLREKYERAVRRPWLLVAPDPPEPK